VDNFLPSGYSARRPIGCTAFPSITSTLEGRCINKRISTLLALSALVFLTTGCAVNRATATITPGADLSRVRTIYIEK
jgi:hypothetical protein